MQSIHETKNTEDSENSGFDEIMINETSTLTPETPEIPNCGSFKLENLNDLNLPRGMKAKHVLPGGIIIHRQDCCAIYDQTDEIVSIRVYTEPNVYEEIYLSPIHDRHKPFKVFFIIAMVALLIMIGFMYDGVSKSVIATNVLVQLNILASLFIFMARLRYRLDIGMLMLKHSGNCFFAVPFGTPWIIYNIIEKDQHTGLFYTAMSMYGLLFMVPGIIISILMILSVVDMCLQKCNVNCKNRSLKSRLNKLLPTYKFSPSAENQDNECAICYEEFNEKSVIRKLNCPHMFHKNCIDQWIDRKKFTCPLCNKKLTDKITITVNQDGEV